MDTYFPEKVVTRHTSDKPWVTDYFRKVIQERQLAKQLGNEVEYKKWKHISIQMAASLKAKYYRNKVAHLKNENLKSWWSEVSKLIGLSNNGSDGLQLLANEKYSGNMSLLADNINSFFTSVSENLPRLGESNKHFQIATSHEAMETPSAFTISVDNVEQKLSKLKLGKATGPDGIPAWLLRDFSTVLSRPLAAIFNSSVREGYVPQLWKSANITPIPKVNPPRDITSDIRPISLTPIVSKVLESCVGSIINKACVTHPDDTQYGCLRGCSTTHALLTMTDQWFKDTDHLGTFERILLLDFSKAFDHINHNILLDKLESLDVHPVAVRWVAGFLLNRLQRVKIGQCTSSWESPNGGVPQGTYLGPTLFTKMIQDAPSEVPLVKYVDDSTLSHGCETPTCTTLQSAVDSFAQWADINDMKLNAKKTKEILVNFGRKNSISDIPPIIIDSTPVERVDHTKLLGLWISSDLTWAKHVEEITKKASSRLYLLSQAKHASLSTNDRIDLYKSLVRPVVEYACPVWHPGLPKYLERSLESIQVRALRAVFPEHTYCDALSEAGLPSLADRRGELTLRFFSQTEDTDNKCHGLLPELKIAHYDTRNKCKYWPPKARTNRYKNSFVPWCVNKI